MQDLVMDFMRVLAAPSLDVRRKTLDLIVDLSSTRNISDIVTFLAKELAKTNSSEEFEKSGEYRQILVRTLHTCGVRFPETAPIIVPQLMEFLSDSKSRFKLYVCLLVKVYLI